MNGSVGYILAVIFICYIWVVQPQLELASLPEAEKVRIFEQKKHEAEVQAVFEKQQEQKIDALLKMNFNQVSPDDMPTWLIYSFWQSNVAKFTVVIIMMVFGGLFIVKRI